MNKNKIIYSINIEDVQKVAEDELGRELDQEELKLIEKNIGDYFSLHETISMAISELIKEQ